MPGMPGREGGREGRKEMVSERFDK